MGHIMMPMPPSYKPVQVNENIPYSSVYLPWINPQWSSPWKSSYNRCWQVVFGIAASCPVFCYKKIDTSIIFQHAHDIGPGRCERRIVV